jgi:hypothetical protein
LDELLAEDRVTVLVAIDIDENEDLQLIRDTWKERGLTEIVAVSPGSLTAQLLDQFGPEIVTPPQAPIVFISADQSSVRLLPSGLKSVEKLKAEIAKGR